MLYATGGQDSNQCGLGTADSPWADMRLRVLRVWCNWMWWLGLGGYPGRG